MFLQSIVLLTVFVAFGESTINQDPAQRIWLTMPVLYCLDTSYIPAEMNMIRSAVSAVTSGTNFAVSFQEVACTDTRNKVHVQPFLSGQTTPAATCSGWNGQRVALATTSEQVMTIARGVNGCLNVTAAGQPGSIRPLAKMFTNVLAKRNEHQRGDRDNYITVNNTNLNPVFATSPYTLYATSGPNSAFWSKYPYDYCSITHAHPTDVFSNGNPVWSFKNGTAAVIPVSDALSKFDCMWLNDLYLPNTGASLSCAQPDCATILAG